MDIIKEITELLTLYGEYRIYFCSVISKYDIIR